VNDAGTEVNAASSMMNGVSSRKSVHTQGNLVQQSEEKMQQSGCPPQIHCDLAQIFGVSMQLHESLHR
jgi:hypothetical protein